MIFPKTVKDLVNVEANLIDNLVTKKKYKEALVILKIVGAEIRLLVKENYQTTGIQLNKKQVLYEIGKIEEMLSSK